MLDKNFRELCSASDSKEIKKLPEKIEKTIKFLELIPKVDFSIYDIEEFKKLMEKDPYQGMLLYWKEIDNRIEFLWKTMAYKSLSLLRGITDLINKNNLLPAIILTRSLFENAAVLHYYLWRIIPTFNEMAKKEIIKK